MAHKYFLQHLLFNGTNITAAVIINLISVIIKLEFMGYSLETAQVYMCVLYILIHIMTCGYCRWKIPA